MRMVGIVGYKNSGKTTLVRALAQELVKRGHRVAAVKHSSEGMDFLEKDTARLREFADRRRLFPRSCACGESRMIKISSMAWPSAPWAPLLGGANSTSPT